MILLLSTLLPAVAAPRSTRDPLPNREVERPAVLPRGWFEVGAELTVDHYEGSWGPLGDKVAGPDEQVITEALAIRYGVSKRAELWWRVPHRWNAGLSDPSFGWKVSLHRDEAPSENLWLGLSWKGPASDFGTRSADSTITLGGRRQLDGLLVRGHASYVRSWPGPVLNPGDRIELGGEGLLQLAPVAVGLAPQWTQRGVSRIDSQKVPTSEGRAWTLSWRVLAHLTRGVDLELSRRVDLQGEDRVIELDEVNPRRGHRWGARAVARW